MKKNLLLLLALSQLLFCCSKKEQMYVSAKSGLNLRVKKSRYSKVIAVIPFNAQLSVIKKEKKVHTILRKSGSWYYVRWNNAKGWVFNAYLSATIIKVPKSIPRLSIKKLKEIRNNHPEYPALFRKFKNMPGGYSFIEGSVGFPSEYIPDDLTIRAENIINGKIFSKNGLIYKSKFRFGKGYLLKIPAGIYRIYSSYPYSGDKKKSPIYFYAYTNQKSKLLLVERNKRYTKINLTHDGK